MITSAELHRAAAIEGLRFDQAEKDYVILLILSGLSRAPRVKTKWIFKGGTCLRHCYYPRYRFSEDIDFTCADTGDNVGSSLALLKRVAVFLGEETGIVLKCKEPRSDKGAVQVEIPIEYSRGGSRRQALPTVKVHLAFDEPLLALPVDRRVEPAYAGFDPFSLPAYAKIEIVAEKARALLQQQARWPRPRDLYDLWYITCHKQERFSREELLKLFQRKCEIRGLAPDPNGVRSQRLYAWNREAWTSQLLPVVRAAPEYELVWKEWVAKSEELL